MGKEKNVVLGNSEVENTTRIFAWQDFFYKPYAGLVCAVSSAFRRLFFEPVKTVRGRLFTPSGGFFPVAP
jgi:hypothetical protein